ncbi:MAG: hypothetical protein R2867_38195 [Caldilineaceae bacterium]
MQNQQLMERGKATLDCVGSDPIELYRGMVVISAEGEPIGHIAAVLTDDKQGAVGTHVVLLLDDPTAHQPPLGGTAPAPTTLHYRLLPIQWIRAIDAQWVHVAAPAQRLLSLPSWHQC